MSDLLPIFDELHEARCRSALAQALLHLPYEILMTFQTVVRRLCHQKHFPEGADYVIAIMTALRSVRTSAGELSECATNILHRANASLVLLAAEDGARP